MSYHDKNIISDSANSSGSKITRTIHLAVVTELLENHRIKARIKGIDKSLRDSDLPVATSLLPLHLQVLPKKGDMVRILLADTALPYSERMWVGPVITDKQYLKAQPYMYGPEISLDESSIHDLAKPAINSEINENLDDIKISGKGNSSVVLGDKGILLTAGEKENEDIRKRNLENKAIINLEHASDKKSTISFLADRFYLIDNTKLNEISEELISKMSDQLQSLAYGETLVSILTLFKDILLTHTHAYNGMEPVLSEKIKLLNKTDFNDIIVDHIKTT